MKRRKSGILVTVFALTTVMIITASAAAASSAYWADMTELNTEVAALNIGVAYESDNLGMKEGYFLPGDSRAFDFTVNNTGDISVDIKPELTLSASGDMRLTGSNFIITREDGTELTESGEYVKEYLDSDGNPVSAEEAADGSIFRYIKYTLADEITLSGLVQKDENEGEKENESTFRYMLKLDEQSGNDFLGAAAQLDVSTYAIQHRNREDGNTEWINIAANQ